jgi:hypothetical protein
MEDLSRFKSIVDDYGNTVQQVPGQKADSSKADELPQPESRGADRLSVLAVKAHELGFKFLESELSYADDVYKQAEKELAPLLAKHNIGSDVDNVPMEEEIKAGLFIGRLWASSIKTIREKREKREKEKTKDEKPKHNARQQAQPVPSEKRPRQESGVNTSQFNTAHQ